MSGVQTIEVSDAEAGLRVDRWFKAHFPDLKHGRLEKLLRTGQIRVDGGRVKANARLEPGQIVRVPPMDDDPSAQHRTFPKVSIEENPLAEDLILHKDEDVLVLNKPHGLAVQGGTKTTRHLDGMLDAFRFGADERPRLVHRLDRDTSGVLVLARSRLAAQALTAAFKARSTRKIYWGLVQGVPPIPQGDINAPLVKMIPRDGDARGELMVAVRPGSPKAKDARPALTRYSVVFQAAQKACWMALMPVTGRTHQIRAHCQVLGTPLVNDVKYGYGEERPPLGGVPDGLHLHAHSLEIRHPKGHTLTVSAPLPDHMRRTWELFGFEPDLWDDPFREF